MSANLTWSLPYLLYGLPSCFLPRGRERENKNPTLPADSVLVTISTERASLPFRRPSFLLSFPAPLAELSFSAGRGRTFWWDPARPA